MNANNGSGQDTWNPLRGAAGASARRKHNHYEVLDVEVGASRSKIRESYIRLKNTFSANNPALYSLMGDEEAKESMAEIEEAFRVLQDDVLRKRYNQSLVADGMPASSFSDLEIGRDPFKETAKAMEEGAGVEGEKKADAAWPAAEGRETPGAAVEKARVAREFNMSNRLANMAHDDEMKRKMTAMLAEAELGDGVVLGQIRDLLKVSIQEIQERTKISPEYVLAIENNFYHKLPALVYTRGFLKTYLQYLGIPDATGVLNAYVEKIKAWQAKHPQS